MALSNTCSSSNTDFLHSDKNPQTYTSRKTNNIRLRWNNRRAILLCWQNSSANLTTTEVLSQRYKGLYELQKDKKRLPKGVILVSMDVTSLYTNIPQEEGINIVCTAYETFYNETTPIPKRFLGKALRLISLEHSLQFNKRNYLQTHRTAVGTKIAVAFANIFMAEIEKQILNESALKPLARKRYIDDIISLWYSSRVVVEKFIEKANKQHPTMKLRAGIS